MSNDLISRSALFEEISSYTFHETSPDERGGEHAAKAHICELIEKQPTAYDVDKVVEQLDSYYEEEDEKGCYIPERIRMKVEDIVKEGAVNV